MMIGNIVENALRMETMWRWVWSFFARRKTRFSNLSFMRSPFPSLTTLYRDERGKTRCRQDIGKHYRAFAVGS
jgi:hypothetical protein